MADEASYRNRVEETKLRKEYKAIDVGIKCANKFFEKDFEAMRKSTREWDRIRYRAQIEKRLDSTARVRRDSLGRTSHQDEKRPLKSASLQDFHRNRVDVYGATLLSTYSQTSLPYSNNHKYTAARAIIENDDKKLPKMNILQRLSSKSAVSLFHGTNVKDNLADNLPVIQVSTSESSSNDKSKKRVQFNSRKATTEKSSNQTHGTPLHVSKTQKLFLNDDDRDREKLREFKDRKIKEEKEKMVVIDDRIRSFLGRVSDLNRPKRDRSRWVGVRGSIRFTTLLRRKPQKYMTAKLSNGLI